jgi:hypothetical protein
LGCAGGGLSGDVMVLTLEGGTVIFVNSMKLVDNSKKNTMVVIMSKIGTMFRSFCGRRCGF